MEAAELGQLWNNAEGQAYMTQLRSQFKADIKAHKPQAQPAS
jgi:hypothetical protein